jgi:hypothetical protein
MDAQRFDALTRLLDAGLSRRRLGLALRGLGLSGGLSLALAGNSTAKKGKKKKCKGGKKRCGKKCVDAQNDSLNCGRCGAICPRFTFCSGGQCGVACGASGFCAIDSATPDCCDGTCTNLKTDPANCGTCGQECSIGEVCVEGLCWTPCPVASDCEVGGGGPKFCAANVLCAAVAGTPVCVAGAECAQVVDCTDDVNACPVGTACAALCCGPVIDAHCVAPG